MAYAISLRNKRTNRRRTAYVGFSWTAFFFGGFVPLCRNDMKWFVISLIVGILGTSLTFGIATLIYACWFGANYNRIHKEALMDDGFEEEADSRFVA